MFLARRIKRSRWEDRSGLDQAEIPADGLTDLRTAGNALSLWRCGTASTRDVERAALALATAPDATRVDKMEIVWLDESTFAEDRILLVETPGKTPVADIAHEHRDASALDAVRLCKIAGRIVNALVAERYRLLRRDEVIQMLIRAIRGGIVVIDSLPKNVRKEIEGPLNRESV